jgi:bisphosphoglycerate-independent phosphoglycerate mutase (AlkP superfamily)
MICSNYTKSPHCHSAANQSSSIRLRSRSLCVRSKTEEAEAHPLRHEGSLRNFSPTLLAVLKLNEPREMTGGDLRAPIMAK